MNPETVTTAQLLGSFTAKHWKIALTTLGLILSTITSAAFLTGQYLAEAKASTEIAELKGEISLVQAKLAIVQSSADAYSAAYNEWRNAQKACEAAMQNKEDKISELSRELGNASNCTFIHKQIEETKEEISSLGIRSALVGEADEKHNAQAIALESRLRGYQEKLGTCN